MGPHASPLKAVLFAVEMNLAEAPGPGAPTFGSLPPGVVQHIVALLEPEDQGRAACVSRLLQQIVEPRAPALFQAAEDGDASRVLGLLRKPSARTGMSTKHTRFQVVEMWGVLRQWRNTDTPLTVAIVNRHTEVASILLAAGAGAAADAAGEFSLEGPGFLLWTACAGDAECVERLLAVGVPVDAVSCADGRSCLANAAGYGLLPSMEALIAGGADVNFASSIGEERSRGTTPLLMATNQGQLEAAALLLEHGAAVNHACALGRTPLHEACSTRGNARLVELLLEKGAAPAAVEATGKTALMRAVQYGDKDMVEALLEAGGTAVVNAADAKGKTALTLACAGGKVTETAMLLTHGAARNAADRNGTTALMAAAKAGHENLVTFMLGMPGVELGAADAEGRTALDHARENGHADVAACLAAAGRRRSPRIRASQR